jgi:hypothetical protein
MKHGCKFKHREIEIVYDYLVMKKIARLLFFQIKERMKRIFCNFQVSYCLIFCEMTLTSTNLVAMLGCSPNRF